MVIVDTSVWIDFFHGTLTRETELLENLLGVHEIGLGDLMLLEVLQGIRKETDFLEVKNRLTSFPIVPMLGSSRAIRCAENYRHLRSLGRTIRSTADVIIASFCIEEGHLLLFSDRDFVPFVEHLGLEAV